MGIKENAEFLHTQEVRGSSPCAHHFSWPLDPVERPDKTFVGWIWRGFSFPGYWITEKGMAGVAQSTWDALQERGARLYEQNAPPKDIRRGVLLYVRR